MEQMILKVPSSLVIPSFKFSCSATSIFNLESSAKHAISLNNSMKVIKMKNENKIQSGLTPEDPAFF